MGRWKLRSRLTLLLSTFLCVYAGLATLAYFTSSHDEDRLETAFAEELMFQADLPVQRLRLRRIDIDADSYLLTRRPEWLSRRKAAIAEFREWQVRLGRRLAKEPEAGEWRAIGETFETYAASQDAILRRAGRGMDPAEAVRLTLAKDDVEGLIARLTRVAGLSLARLDRERRDARRAALATIAFILAIGLAGGTALAAATSSVIVAPMIALRDEAAAWKLGEPWIAPAEDAPFEIHELIETMRAMAAKLNAQFERERQESRLKSQLVSGVSHEFNNALAVISTAHMLLQESASGAEAEPWHEMLEANIRALSAMATNLLNLGRLESGKFRLETRRVEPGPLLADALRRLDVLGRHKRQTIALEVPEALPAVAADAEAVSLVVANLLTNAFKYTAEGGSVTLGAARRPDGRVEVYVKDTGIGVAGKEREKIFGGWYRTEEGKKAAKGFGVGLALSRMILEAHGTKLELESEPGKGSRFFFSLPPYDAKAAGSYLG